MNRSPREKQKVPGINRIELVFYVFGPICHAAYDDVVDGPAAFEVGASCGGLLVPLNADVCGFRGGGEAKDVDCGFDGWLEP